MQCAICFRKKWSSYKLSENRVFTDCNHVFCRGCILEWVRSDNYVARYKCPVCRGYLSCEWRSNLLVSTTAMISTRRPQTRLSRAKKRVEDLLTKWQTREIPHTKEGMLGILEEIVKEKMIFKHDKEFKRTYNERVNRWIDRHGEDFVQFIVD